MKDLRVEKPGHPVFAPATKAGRALLEREALNSRSFALIRPEDIHAIEAEAAALSQWIRFRSPANARAAQPATAPLMGACDCRCVCHGDEGPDWPGPCAGCCEPGDECKCGIALEEAGVQRSIYPTEFTRPDYAMWDG